MNRQQLFRVLLWLHLFHRRWNTELDFEPGNRTLRLLLGLTELHPVLDRYLAVIHSISVAEDLVASLEQAHHVGNAAFILFLSSNFFVVSPEAQRALHDVCKLPTRGQSETYMISLHWGCAAVSLHHVNQTQKQTGRLLKARLVLLTCGPPLTEVRKGIGSSCSSSASKIITLPPSIIRVAASPVTSSIRFSNKFKPWQSVRRINGRVKRRGGAEAQVCAVGPRRRGQGDAGAQVRSVKAPGNRFAHRTWRCCARTIVCRASTLPAQIGKTVLVLKQHACDGGRERSGGDTLADAARSSVWPPTEIRGQTEKGDRQATAAGVVVRALKERLGSPSSTTRSRPPSLSCGRSRSYSPISTTFHLLYRPPVCCPRTLRCRVGAHPGIPGSGVAGRGTSGSRSGRGWWRPGAERAEFAVRRAVNVHVGGAFFRHWADSISRRWACMPLGIHSCLCIGSQRPRLPGCRHKLREPCQRPG